MPRAGAVVWLHDGNFVGAGSFTSAKVQQRIRKELSSISERVDFPDLSGKSHDELETYVKHVLDGFGEGQVLLIGASSGGFTAAQFGGHRAVRGVVSLASPLLPYTRALLVSSKRRGTFEHFEAGRKMPAGMTWSAENCSACFKAERDLVRSGCGAPMLAIVGTRDAAVPPAVYETSDYRSVVNGGKMITLDRTHAAIYRASAPILGMIIEWWNDVQPGSRRPVAPVTPSPVRRRRADSDGDFEESNTSD